MGNDNIYGENVKSPKTQNRFSSEPYRPLNTSENLQQDTKELSDGIIYIDGDKGLTTMDCILRIKHVIDESPMDTEATIYVVKTDIKKSTFDWKVLLQYLSDSKRNYKLVYRGYIADIDFLMAFDLKCITVYISESASEIGMLQQHNYKFEIL